jgi:hypothetical protein
MQNTSIRKEEAAHSVAKMVDNMGNTVVTILDKLAGKESDVKLSFQDLTLEMGMMKARLNGAIVLDIVYAKEAESEVAKSSTVTA